MQQAIITLEQLFKIANYTKYNKLTNTTQQNKNGSLKPQNITLKTTPRMMQVRVTEVKAEQTDLFWHNFQAVGLEEGSHHTKYLEIV